jgi:hypothetical protein
MGLWQAIASAMRTARDSKRGRLSVGSGLAVAVGSLVTWLAARRRGVPPVRVTGVAENAIFPPETPPK